MAEWLALAEIAARAGEAQRAMAWRGQALVPRERFIADVQAWCAAFQRAPGARIALYFEDSLDFACALFGAWHAGKAVWLPGDAQPATLQRLKREVDGWAGDAVVPASLKPEAGAQPVLAPLDRQRTSLVVFTSGSTGEPVAIHKTLAQLDAEVHALQAEFGAPLDAAGAVTVRSTVSHQHIYGLLFSVLWPLAAGRPFATERIVYPEQMAAQLGEGRSVLIASPAHLTRLPEVTTVTSVTVESLASDLNSAWQPARAHLQAVFSSGGPLSAEGADNALRVLGPSPIEVFGSSETGGIAWRQRARDGEIWRAFPLVEWRLDEGLLAVRSPNLPDDAWHLTADRAERAGDGFVLKGRADRIVKIEEKRVSITALEQALRGCAEVGDARLVVLPTEDEHGSAAGPVRLGAVVVLSDAGRLLIQAQGKHAMNERLRAAMLTAAERVAVPRRFRYLHALPVNAQGKVTDALLTVLFRPLLPAVTWLAREAAQAEAELDILPQLAVFDGHFNEAPLLPGVAQLDWALRFGRDCFALPSRFARADALKFLRPVRPGTRLKLSLHWKPERQLLQFQYSSSAGPHASGNLVFETSDA